MTSGSSYGTPWRWFFRDRGHQNQDFCFLALSCNITIFIGPPMQNGHFYFCTPDIVGVRFLKNSHFVKDILTIFQNTLRCMLLYEKCVFLSFDHPSHVKCSLFFLIKDFLASPEIKEVADRRQGSSFLAFFIFFIWNYRSL